MKQYPSRLKFKKYHRIGKSRFQLQHQGVFLPKFGFLALKALEAAKLTFNQIEAGRKTIRRITRKEGFIWVNLFTYMSSTSKPVASRMGKGKGAHSHWICPVRAGQILYEVGGVPNYLGYKALGQAASKMPMRSCIVRLVY